MRETGNSGGVQEAVKGEEAISSARLPGVPARRRAALQHEHGTVQFRDNCVRELK